MAPGSRRLFRWIVTLVVLGTLGACGAIVCGLPRPLLPALLRGADARGGYWGACPSRDGDDARAKYGGLALSPQLEARLQEQFAPGTPEAALVSALAEQKFEMFSPCDEDTSVRRAGFVQKGGGLTFYSMTASVYWKVDSSNRIVWTHGFVAFTGL